MTWLLENLWLKIISLAIGLLLWFHVATDKVYEYDIRLPVTVILLSDSLTLSESPPDSILVTVSAVGKQLLRNKWKERGLIINATQYNGGRYLINLSKDNTSLVNVPADINLDKIISPASITLSIDQMVDKKVAVLVDIVTQPDEGFAVSKISPADPPTVTLSGARSRLREKNSIKTVFKELTGLRSNITVKLPLLLPEEYQTFVSPESVSVAIEVVPVKTRIFEKIPVVIYNTPSDRMIRISPENIDIELTGPPEDIDLLNKNTLVASVDFRTLDSNRTAPIKIDCPSNFKVKTSSVKSVKFFIN